MAYSKQIAFVALIAVAVLATAGGIKKNTSFTNLKVLPPDISDKQLDSIMDSYNKSLHVSCDFCHVKQTDFSGISSGEVKLDFAKDGDMKEYARKMIRLQVDINKNYFGENSKIKPEYMNTVSCFTCHRGNAFPTDN